tara:strand:- start:51028 stop:51207 length:180 start_codon:yes stop_codon:yes gene_type:complete
MASQGDKGNGLEKTPLQRKTTLKWRENGELSEIDMARILSRLNKAELTKCDFSCDVENK